MAFSYQQTLKEAENKFSIPAQWASFDCQNGLYIPKLLKALGFNMNTENIFAKRKLNGVKIGKDLFSVLTTRVKLVFSPHTLFLYLK